MSESNCGYVHVYDLWKKKSNQIKTKWNNETAKTLDFQPFQCDQY